MNQIHQPLAIGPLSDYYDYFPVSVQGGQNIYSVTVHERVTTTIQRQILNVGLNQVWRQSFFRILANVAKFLVILKGSIRHNRPHQHLGSLQYQVVNDICYQPSEQQIHSRKHSNGKRLFRKGSLIKRFIKNKDNFLMLKRFNRAYLEQISSLGTTLEHYISRIHINVTFIQYWDIFQLFLLLFESGLIPFSIAFKIPEQTLYQSIQIVPVVCFVVDVLINFFKGFYEKGQLVNDPMQCVLHYFYGSFWIDLITIITFFIAVFFANFRYLEYVSLLRVIRMGNRYTKDIEENFNLQERWGSGILTLLKLCIFIIVSIHFIACLWVLVGTSDLGGYPTTWLRSIQMEDASWSDQYKTSIYWTVVTMITVGYGDIVPQNPDERLCAIVIMVYTCASFAYCINVINGIFSEMNKNDEEYRVQMSRLNIYMSQRLIPDQLQRKVRRQLEYIYEEKQRGRLQTDIVLQGISKTLKDEVLVAVNMKIIQKISFFKDNFSTQFLEKISQIIKDVTIGPEDYIYKESETQRLALYFVEEGEVELLLDGMHKQAGKTTIIRTIRGGEWFGEYSFFSSQARETSARSIGVTYLNYILKNDLDRLFESYPNEYLKFCELRESLTFYKQYERLGMRCVSCQSRKHIIYNCPIVTYQPNREFLIRKFLHTTLHIRNKWKRKKCTKFSALNDKLVLLEGFQRYYDDHEALYENVDLTPIIDSSFFEAKDFKDTNNRRKTLMRSITALNRNAHIDDERKVILQQKLKRIKSSGHKASTENLQKQQSMTSHDSAKPVIVQLLQEENIQTLEDEINPFQVLQPEQQGSHFFLDKEQQFDYVGIITGNFNQPNNQAQEQKTKIVVSPVEPPPAFRQNRIKIKSPTNYLQIPSRDISEDDTPSIYSNIRLGHLPQLQLGMNMGIEDDMKMKVEDGFEQFRNYKHYRSSGNIDQIINQINLGYINQMHHLRENRMKKLTRFVHNAEMVKSKSPDIRRKSIHVSKV